jgi:hypothetical protein
MPYHLGDKAVGFLRRLGDAFKTMFASHRLFLIPSLGSRPRLWRTYYSTAVLFMWACEQPRY